MFTEDLSVFFDTAEFADSAMLNSVSVFVIFDEPYALASVGQFGMASSQPSATLPTASVPASPVGMPFVIRGTSYTVAAHEPDGTGISRLMLERA